MNAGGPRDLPGRLRDGVVRVDPATEVHHAEQQEEERDQDQRELDEGLAPRAFANRVSVPGRHGFTLIVTAPVVLEPAALVTLRVTS